MLRIVSTDGVANNIQVTQDDVRIDHIKELRIDPVEPNGRITATLVVYVESIDLQIEDEDTVVQKTSIHGDTCECSRKRSGHGDET